MSRLLSFIIAFYCLFLLSACQGRVTDSERVIVKSQDAKVAYETRDTSHAIIGTPKTEDSVYPIVFVFSPQGDAKRAFQRFKPIAEKYGWIIWASKEYRNHYPDAGELLRRVKGRIDRALETLPVDSSRVILTGMSGGTSFSQCLNLYYPGIADVLILNTGRIWDFCWEDIAENPKLNMSALYRRDSRMIAVFLASPTDFRYEEMKRDRDLYERYGWHTKWIEFPGGHIVAPRAKYFEGIDWMLSLGAWQFDETSRKSRGYN